MLASLVKALSLPRVRIRLDPHASVGTPEVPYRTDAPPRERRRAIEVELRRRVAESSKASARKQQTALKRRMNVLRLYNKNEASSECYNIEDDMRWFDASVYHGETGTVCRKLPPIRAGDAL